MLGLHGAAAWSVERWTRDDDRQHSDTVHCGALPETGLVRQIRRCRAAADAAGHQDSNGTTRSASPASTRTRARFRAYQLPDNTHALSPHGARRAAGRQSIFLEHLITSHHRGKLFAPGDYVVMQALDDLVCASTACRMTSTHSTAGTQRTCMCASTGRSAAPCTVKRRRADVLRKAPSPATSADHPIRAGPDLWAPVTFPAVGTIGEGCSPRARDAARHVEFAQIRYHRAGCRAALQRTMTKDVAFLAIWRGSSR